MLMKRRRVPVSSTSRSFMPGNCRSRSARTWSTESPLASTCALPFVTDRSGVGMRTITGMCALSCQTFRLLNTLLSAKSMTVSLRMLNPSRVLPLILLLGYGAAFAFSSLGVELLVFDDHPGQLVRLWHVLTF